MPLDYSKFNDIADSDSDADGPALDLSSLFPGAGADKAEDSDSQQESPREVLARMAASQPRSADRETTSPGENRPGEPGLSTPATFDRFLELVEGAVLLKGEDAIELLSVARATTQSALATGSPELPRRLVRALCAGLAAEPKPVPFAREQAPELVAEVLAIGAAGLVDRSEVDELQDLLLARSRLQEVYTFVLEALSGDELGAVARISAIGLLRRTLLGMEDNKRHLFIGSCLPAMLKRALTASTPGDLLPEYLSALRGFATALLPEQPEEGPDMDHRAVAQCMVSAFLFKALPLTMPHVIIVRGLEARASSEEAVDEPELKKVRGPAALSGGQGVQLSHDAPAPAALEALCSVAQAAANASTRSLPSLLEGMDTGDPTGDGGGDLELSPLSLAACVCLAETPGCWQHLRPQLLPIVLSPVRRLNVLMRSCFVLVSCGEQAPEVISVGEDCPGASSSLGARRARWAHHGLELFARSAAPLLREAAAQTPKAFASLSGPLCRWYPQRTFRALLEALASTPDVDRQARASLFQAIRDAMRQFSWPCRFQLYRDIITKCRVDSIIGTIVTLFKDDWWPRVMALAAEDRAGQERERASLIDIMKATLSGDVQIVDGMDTLTAALNLARLVSLASLPAAAFLRAGLRKGGPGIDLDGMLAVVSQQIDFELKLLDDPATSNAAHDAAAQAVREELGQNVDLQAMKRERITMVAHLVARVREVFMETER